MIDEITPPATRLHNAKNLVQDIIEKTQFTAPYIVVEIINYHNALRLEGH